MVKKSIISFENVSVRLQGKLILRDIDWNIFGNESWAILGPNGSGKSTLVKAIFGGVDICKGKIIYNFGKKLQNFCSEEIKNKIGYVSFELHQNILIQEDFLNVVRNYAGKDEETMAKDVIWSSANPTTPFIKGAFKKIVKILKIKSLLNKSFVSLSSGQARKVLIARALMKEPKILILDEPFDSLDEKSRKDLMKIIDKLIGEKINIILITHRAEEVSEKIENVLRMEEGRILEKGRWEQIPLTPFHLKGELVRDPVNKLDLENLHHIDADVLIKFENVNVIYGKKKVLDNVSFEIREGENVAILGPNGSGKSTILKLITGENVQGYANNITIFGHKKGTNQSLWDIRKNIGFVSANLQLEYRKSMTVFDVICSGFYDSIGLYRYPSKEEEEIAKKWIKILEIENLANEDFIRLSYGQKRMVLIARAVVKSPKLLILDEPTHGLDMVNRDKVLDEIQKIGELHKTNIIYVTHHEQEILPCIDRVINLEKGKIVVI